MKIIKSKRLCRILNNIESELAKAIALTKIAEDSCEYNKYFNQKFVISLALQKYNNVAEKVSNLYL